MMKNPPMCYNCEHFRGLPTSPNGKAKCSLKPKGVPNKIYWENGKCSVFKMKRSKNGGR